MSLGLPPFLRASRDRAGLARAGRGRHRHAWWLAATACAALACPAGAQLVPPKQVPPQRIRTPDFAPEAPPTRVEPEPARWRSVGADGSLGPATDDPRGAWETCAALVLEPARAAPEDRALGTLVLADGQRIRGSLQIGADGARWKSRWMPLQPVRAEGTRAIVLKGATAPAATEADVVVLANGDRLDGIVAGVDGAGVRLERGVGTDRSETLLPWERVRSVSFVGAAEPEPQVRAWLADGSVVGGAAGTWTTGDVLQIGPAPGSTVGTRINLPRAAIVGVSRGGACVQPLAALVPALSEAPDGAGLRYSLAAPARAEGQWPLDAPPLEVEGPVRLAYAALPAPATLVLSARLDPAVRGTGVVDVVVRGASGEVARARLDGSTPDSDMRAEIPAGPFEIVLMAADGSAVGDLVRLERALLVCRSPR